MWNFSAMMDGAATAGTSPVNAPIFPYATAWRGRDSRTGLGNLEFVIFFAKVLPLFLQSFIEAEMLAKLIPGFGPRGQQTFTCPGHCGQK